MLSTFKFFFLRCVEWHFIRFYSIFSLSSGPRKTLERFTLTNRRWRSQQGFSKEHVLAKMKSTGFFVEACRFLSLVLLSGHDSKKYQAALRFKKHLAENQSLLPKVIMSEEPSMCKRETDEFGELATKRIGCVQKRLTSEDIDMLILEYQSGKTPTELSERFGCHRITVCKILKRRGIYESTSTKLREAKYAEELVAGYQAGKSVRTLEKELGADSRTISRILKEHGIVVNKRRAQAKVNTAKAIQMYEEMHTTKEIAQHFGVSPKAVLTCLREHGVKIRGRWDYAIK